MSKLAKLSLGRLAALCALSVLAYVAVVRPWHMRWGATDQEVEGLKAENGRRVGRRGRPPVRMKGD